MGFLSKHIGLDLGTSSVQICRLGFGIVLNEPTVVAVDKPSGKILAVGNEANSIIDKNPDNIIVVRPVKDGVISDFDITREMLKRMFQICLGNCIIKPRVVATIPIGITGVQRRALEEAILSAGAKSVYFVEKSMAAALGVGLSVDEVEGRLIADIGGGTVDVAVVSLGGIVSGKSVRVGGNCLDKAIINHIKKHHSINIGQRIAEQIKIAIGNVFDDGESTEYVVHGRDSLSGLPNEILVTSDEIRDALKDSVAKIIETISSVIEQCPAELASDIMETGIILTGGGSKLPGLENVIKTQLNIPVIRVENGEICVAEGAAMVFSSL